MQAIINKNFRKLGVNMFFVIYTDLKNKITRYYYLKNNDIYYNEYINNVYKVLKQNSLYDFYKLFRISNKAKFLENNNQYTIYLDENGYKHYIKDFKEDFLQFFLNNGQECIMYSNNNSNQNQKVKKFLFKSALLSVSIICSIELFKLMENNNYFNKDIKAEISYEAINTEINYSDIFNIISKLENIPVEYRNKILNSGIIESILPYYDDIELSILMNSKLDNLSIEYYDDKDIQELFIEGYYSPLIPNVIYLKHGTNGKAFTHEFIHLLQHHKYSLEYLVEPTAALMDMEFFESDNVCYKDEISNLKLLICTIGPEPILRCNFSGDESMILDILENNLEKEDYEKMVSYLTDSSATNKTEQNQEIRKLIETLYKNMYKTEMKDTLPGYDLITNQNIYSNIVDNRYYLNKNELELSGEISFEINSEFYDLIPKNINLISTKEINYYRKEITEEEYNQLDSNNNQKDYEIKIEYSDEVKEIRNSEYGMEVVVSEDDRLYQYNHTTAIEKGYIKYIYITSEDKIDLEDNTWIFDHQNKKITATLPPITASNSLNENLEIQVEQMLTGMINGTMDTNGNFIKDNQNSNNNKLRGFSYISLIGIISIITSLGILLIGTYICMK